jgi:hypothetical protein
VANRERDKTANEHEADPTPMDGDFAEDDSSDEDLPTTKREESQAHGDTESGDTESDRGDKKIDDGTRNRGP